SLVAGTSFRLQSGPPRNVLGPSDIYTGTPGEVFLLPSGSAGRNDVYTTWDLQLAYVRRLSHRTTLQLFFAAYNVLNTDTVTSRVDTYTTDFVTPVVNGTFADLGHLK